MELPRPNPSEIIALAEHHPDAHEALRDNYLSPESLSNEELLRLLEEGEVRNIHRIEELGQAVSPHQDRVLTGELNSILHKDSVLEAELIAPELDKPLLIVYKPMAGINKGNLNEEIQVPTEASPYHQKEVAAWIVGQELNLSYLLLPVTVRNLNEGIGSVRPYFWGEPLDQLDDEAIDEVLDQQESMEDIAVIDYLLQTLDRRPNNILTNKETKNVKLIDHSLTFVDESYALRYNLKGPRLMVAYERGEQDWSLARKLLPERLVQRLESFKENEQSIREKLSSLLSKSEIDGIFKRTQKLLDSKIFL